MYIVHMHMYIEPEETLNDFKKMIVFKMIFGKDKLGREEYTIPCLHKQSERPRYYC